MRKIWGKGTSDFTLGSQGSCSSTPASRSPSRYCMVRIVNPAICLDDFEWICRRHKDLGQ